VSLLAEPAEDGQRLFIKLDGKTHIAFTDSLNQISSAELSWQSAFPQV
jgi:hypothetical protein